MRSNTPVLERSRSTSPRWSADLVDASPDRGASIAEADLLALVEDAARQREYMLPWEADRKLTNEGWDTIYAVDADVFRFYGDPGEIARPEGGRLGYAEVFRGDAPLGTRVLAHRLVDYIFFELQPNRPLVVIPPIDSEVRRIIVALTMQLGTEPIAAPFDMDKTRELLARVSNLSDTDEIPIDVVNSLNYVFGPRGIAVQQTNYIRLLYLLELRRLVSGRSISSDDGYSENVRSVLCGTSLHGVYDHSELVGEWISRLTKGREHVVSEGRHDTLLYDANALARLEAWNDRLSGEMCRILYITGSAHVLAAAEAHNIGGITFKDLYIRHPKYFLASPDVVATDGARNIERENSGSPFYDWVRTFLADVEMSRMNPDEPDLHPAMVRRAHQRDPSLGRHFKDNWDKHLEGLGKTYRPPPGIERLTIDSLDQGRPREAGSEWADLRTKLNERIEALKHEAWEACFRSATRVGFFVASAAPLDRKPLPARLVPPLRFDSWPKTDAFVRRMAQWRGAQDIDVKDYNLWLGEMKAETDIDYRYAYYLAHAALFAARGNWKIGAILSKRALDQAILNKDVVGSLGHGREAGYLAAHCVRHTARSPSDLDEVDTLLDQVEKTYKEELGTRPLLIVLPERFAVERIATILSRYFFFLFDAGIKRSTSEVRQQVRTDGTVGKARSSLVALRNGLAFNNRVVRDDTISMPLQYEFVRIDVNIVFTSILLGDMQGPLIEQAGRRLLNLPKERSFYQNTLRRFWNVTREEKGSNRGEAARLLKTLRGSGSRRYSVFPYDAVRYAFLAALIEEWMEH